MHLIQILLPLQDDEGRSFAAEFEGLVRELTERFGGVTSYSRSPADGRWKEDAKTERDDIVVLEIMTAEVDRSYWSALRRRLERQFRQDEIVIRRQDIERL